MLVICLTIVVIGAGAIGGAIAKGLIAGGHKVMATEKNGERRKELEAMGIASIDDNKRAAKEADILFLSVKPRDVAAVLSEIRGEIKGKLIISVAAAVSLAFLRSRAPETKFIRVMPNVAILVQESYIAYTAGAEVTAEEKAKAESLLANLGRIAEINESHMDAITALSGCAPAYLSIIIEAMTYAGLQVGLSKDVALAASAQAMLGTAKIILESQKSPLEIRDMVTTPGGVTIAGLQELEKIPIRHAFMSAVKAADEKSRKISENFT